MNESVKPITPVQARKDKINVIPPEVIESVNQFLIQRINGQHSIIITQDELILAAQKKLPNVSRAVFFDRHWLDFEDLYRSHWKVTFDKPGYNEDYPASWTFVPKSFPDV